MAAALAGELEAGHSDELKAFVVRQLQLCGQAEEVPALAKLLTSDRLCDPVTQALAVIGGSEALQVLKESQKSAQGDRKAAISQAIAMIQNRSEQ